ncbi:hypothetical protein M8J76_004055 [Diaphorina citri]|nr:hypothetical protein M8J76_004055 [Diaphorina citri]
MIEKLPNQVDTNQNIIELKVENLKLDNLARNVLKDHVTELNGVTNGDAHNGISRPISNHVTTPENVNSAGNIHNHKIIPENIVSNGGNTNIINNNSNLNINENSANNGENILNLNNRDVRTTRSNKLAQLFNRFHRKTNNRNFDVTADACKQHEGSVQVISFNKIQPGELNIDANNNSEVVDDKSVVIHAGENGTGVKKKMSDDDDDTRLIRPRDPREPEEPEESPVPGVQTQTPNLISWWTWIAYSQGHVYNDLCASMWFTYLLPYFQKCVLLSPSNAGLLMLIGQVADALATPVIGLYSDRGSTAWYCALGRRKTWHIIGSVLVTFSFPFIFSPVLPFLDFSSSVAHVAYFVPFICLFQFGWAAVQIAHLSLVPDLTPNENERTSLLSVSLLSVRYAFTVISNLLVYIIMYIAVGSSSDPGQDTLGPSDSTKFQYISYIVVVLGYISTIVFYLGVSEIRNRQLQLDLRQTSSSQMYEAKKRTPRQLLTMPTLYTVAVLYMTARLFFNILQMFIVFYVQDTLVLSKVNIALVPLVILISGFVTSLIIKPCNVRLGRKLSHVIGLCLGILVSVIVYIGTAEPGDLKLVQVYFIAVLYGISSTVIQVTSFGMAADFVGDDVSNGAFIYGILSFADKTSNGVVGFFIQKFNPEEGYYYRLALAYGCGIPCLVGILALLFFPPVPQVRLKPVEDDRRPVVPNDTSEDELERSTVSTLIP